MNLWFSWLVVSLLCTSKYVLFVAASFLTLFETVIQYMELRNTAIGPMYQKAVPGLLPSALGAATELACHLTES